MRLNQLLKELSYSEFANLSVGESGTGEIKEHRIPSVVSSINDALLRLYSKFLQDHKQLILIKLEDQIKYVLDSRFAESTGAPVPYILDAGNPFTDDIIKIVSIQYRDPELNEFLDVDKRFRRKPITVNVPKTVNLPAEVPVDELLYVNYRASHPVVVLDEDTEIICPPSAIEAVKAYVAYKEYASMNTETSVAKGQEYLGLFNTICDEIVDRDTIGVTEEFRDTRFQDRGYV